MRLACYLLSIPFAFGCSPPAHKQQQPSASAEAIPFENVKPDEKILMGRWGSIVVDGEYHDDDASPIHLKKGVTTDITYARRNDASEIDGRFAVGHEDVAGDSLPDPDTTEMPGSDFASTDCAGGSTFKTKDGLQGRVACGKTSLGSGIVGTVRKAGRVYHLVCVEHGASALASCVRYAEAFSPS